jgi:hypothetical protein
MNLNGATQFLSPSTSHSRSMEIQNLDMDKGNQIWSSILVKFFNLKMQNIPTFDWPLSNS